MVCEYAGTCSILDSKNIVQMHLWLSVFLVACLLVRHNGIPLP
jgi:hypothetical protein